MAAGKVVPRTIAKSSGVTVARSDEHEEEEAEACSRRWDDSESASSGKSAAFGKKERSAT